MKFIVLDGTHSGKEVHVGLSQAVFDPRTCEPHQAAIGCPFEARVIPIVEHFNNANELRIMQKFNNLDRTINLSIVFNSAEYDKSITILFSGPIINYLSYKSNQQVEGIVKIALYRNTAVHMNNPYPPDQQWLASGEGSPPLVSVGGTMVHHVIRGQTFMMNEVEISRSAWLRLRGYPLRAYVKLQLGFPLIPPNESGDLNKKILSESIATDLSIVCGNGVNICCHKSFLMAASPVFAAMLSSKMKEASTNKIDMSDMSEEGIKAFLAFLYYQDLTIALASSELAIEVIKAADKYDVPELRKRLSKAIGTQSAAWFNPDSALEMYHFSLQVNDAGLTLKSLHAIKDNMDELMKRPSYLKLFKENPAAAMDLCKSAFNLIPAAAAKKVPANGPASSDGAENEGDEGLYRRRVTTVRSTTFHHPSVQLVFSAPQYLPHHHCTCVRHAIHEAVHDAVVNMHIHDHFYGHGHGNNPDHNNNFQNGPNQGQV